MEEKIVIAIPSGRGETAIEFTTAIIAMILKTREKYPKMSFATMTCSRTYIHQSRQTLMESFVDETTADRILFIDDDNIPPEDGLIRLLEHDKPIASGLYFRRKPPYEPIIMMKRRGGEGSERRADLWRNGDKEPFVVHSTGFGFILIKREVPVKMRESRVSMFDMRAGVGEDIWFCIQAGGAGYDVWVDPKCIVGHIGDREIITDKHYEDYFKEHVENLVEKAKTVSGYMSEKELQFLAEHAAYSYFTIEVGTWQGRSATVLSKSLRLICVDKFDGMLEGKKISESQLDVVKEKFKEFPNVQFLQGDSTDLASNFPNDCADLILIDGGHSYDQAKSDIEKYFDKLRIGGKMVVHDYAIDWTDVMKACDEFAETHKPICATRKVPDTSFFEIVKL
jgi:predicted O-methyltransferase YrrM